MTIGLYQRGAGVFSRRRDIAYALEELKKSGFPMEKVSVVVRDIDREDNLAGVDVRARGGNEAGDGAVAGAVTGGAVGGIMGLLGALGALTVPGIGPVLAGGIAASALATTLAGGAIGAAAGGCIGVLIGLGIPEEEARGYNDRVVRGDYLLMVEGTSDEIRLAEAIVRSGGVQDWGVYNVPPAADGVANTTRQAQQSGK